MNRAVVAVITLSLAACAVKNKTLYQPVDENLRVEGTVCGFVPYANARLALDQNVSASLSLADDQGGVALGIQLPLVKDQTVRFEPPSIELEAGGARASASLQRWQVAVMGRDGRPGHHEYVNAADELKGLGRNESLATEHMAYLKSDLFISSARFSIKPADIVTVRLPPIRVNGSNKLIGPIVFRRIEKTAVYACVQ